MKNMFKSKKKNAEAFDENLINIIQPMGGITFKEPGHYETGSGYVKVIHIYKLPKNLRDFWLDKIMNIEETIATIDIHTQDLGEVKKNINRSLKEENVRFATAKNFSEIYDAKKRQDELAVIFDELESYGEIVKLLDFRVYVMGRNQAELDERVETIIKSLESDSYRAGVYLNEGKRDFLSLYESFTAQRSKLFCADPHPLMCETISVGDPFNYSELIDDEGSLLGFTHTGGVVLFDEFTVTANRTYYNGLACGKMGSGKSTFLKKRFKTHAARGNFVRTFDVSGEFADLTKEFGGKILKCSEGNGILNIMEILKAGEDDGSSYTRHIEKVSTFFRCVSPGMTEDDIIMLQNYLKEFYTERRLTPNEENCITGLPANRYPMLSDFWLFLENRLEDLTKAESETRIEEEIIISDAKGLNKLTQSVKNLVENYGNMFNCYTSIDNLADEKVVTFDISEIKDLGNAFIAQMFNLVSLCWDNAISNGEIMKKMYEDGELSIMDVTKFLILIDESHRWVNTDMPMILKKLIQYFREARKYFAGILLASQSVRDFMPEGYGSPYINDLKTLFELTQYKFMFNQDSSVLELISKVFNDSLSFSQLRQIPMLKKGEAILSISSDRSLKFKVWLSKKYEERLFAGGR